MEELHLSPEPASPEVERTVPEPEARAGADPAEQESAAPADLADPVQEQASEAEPEMRDSPDGGLTAEPEPGAAADALFMEEFIGGMESQGPAPEPAPVEDSQLRAVLEAVVYVAEEPLTLAQLAAALSEPPERIRWLLTELMEEFDKPEHGLAIREVAGGFKMTTKPEHHEAVRDFVKSLKPPLKLSLPALETLAVIAYKQPVTAPEIMEIRGVQGAGVLKTLLDRKLIATAGRKNVLGKPILYRTTKEFLIQFGLKDLAELPSLKEFEEIRRLAIGDVEPEAEPSAGADDSDAETVPETRPLPLVDPPADSTED